MCTFSFTGFFFSSEHFIRLHVALHQGHSVTLIHLTTLISYLSAPGVWERDRESSVPFQHQWSVLLYCIPHIFPPTFTKNESWNQPEACRRVLSHTDGKMLASLELSNQLCVRERKAINSHAVIDRSKSSTYLCRCMIFVRVCMYVCSVIFDTLAQPVFQLSSRTF